MRSPVKIKAQCLVQRKCTNHCSTKTGRGQRFCFAANLCYQRVSAVTIPMAEMSDRGTTEVTVGKENAVLLVVTVLWEKRKAIQLYFVTPTKLKKKVVWFHFECMFREVMSLCFPSADVLYSSSKWKQLASRPFLGNINRAGERASNPHPEQKTECSWQSGHPKTKMDNIKIWLL